MTRQRKVNINAHMTKTPRRQRNTGWPYVATGLAVAGAGFALASLSDETTPSANQAVQLTSISSPMATPPLGPPCALNFPLCEVPLFGPGASTPAAYVL